MQIYKDWVRQIPLLMFRLFDFFDSMLIFISNWYFLPKSIRYIRRGKPDAGFALFESESLKWPGFVEFDDVNGKVLTYSAQDRYLFPFLFFFVSFY